MSFAASLDAIYAAMGVDAVMVIDDSDGAELEIRVLYMPGGKDLQQHTISTGTVEMAAAVRRQELADNGIEDLATIYNATLTVNGEDWRVDNWYPLPWPEGEAAGEVRLVLKQ